MSNAYTLLIIYAIIDLTPWYIVCMYCLLVVEAVLYQFKQKIGKLNGDLLQPSGIRYEVWSFSVIHLISIAYWKGLISGVKLSVVVPQAIGISLRNRVHCCQNLRLSLHPFVPWSTFVFFPSLSFSCEIAIERWRIEVVEAQVGDSFSPICKCADRGCIHCNLWFYINRNIFSYPIMYVWMNILSMDDFKCLYIVDYIC